MFYGSLQSYHLFLFFSRSLVKHLTEYIRLNNLPQIEKFSEEFPESVTIQQAVGVWKYVADIT